MVNSDFKNNRVEDPTTVSTRQEKNVKKYVKDFFDKAVSKKRAHDQKKADRKTKGGESKGATASPDSPNADFDEKVDQGSDAIGGAHQQDDSADTSRVTTPAGNEFVENNLKRKRQDEDASEGPSQGGSDVGPSKKVKSESPEAGARDMTSEEVVMEDVAGEVRKMEEVSFGVADRPATGHPPEGPTTSPPDSSTGNDKQGFFATHHSTDVNGRHDQTDETLPLTPGSGSAFVVNGTFHKVQATGSR